MKPSFDRTEPTLAKAPVIPPPPAAVRQARRRGGSGYLLLGLVLGVAAGALGYQLVPDLAYAFDAWLAMSGL